ncbi:MAG TPA: hypothetical protein VGJ56_15335 [Reyranella sp.]|jgi:hypothetical protein
MTAARSLTDAERAVLQSVMDRLVPPIDDLPGAGSMGLLDQVEAMAGTHPPFHLALLALLGSLPVATFAGLPGADQDKAISRFETAHPAVFNAALEMVYLAYYGDSRVHGRIGWRGGPLQPGGFALPPFDEAILEKPRQRQPFWRRVPE